MQPLAREALHRPAITKAKAPGLKRVQTREAQLYIWNGFLNAEDCAQIIALADPNLRPSTITRPDQDPYFRTSSTCDLLFVGDRFVADLDQKISDALGFPVTYGEPIQAQAYEIGQEFKAHTDFFEEDRGEYEEHAAIRGQRTWTFMIYLNDVEGGGHTRFTKLDRKVKPKIGRAVVWNNLLEDGSPNHQTMHHGEPVTAGRKVVITKWFREKPQGPAPA